MCRLEKKLFLIMIFFTLFGCSKDFKFKKNNVYIYSKLKEIGNRDQNVRSMNIQVLKKYKIRTFETIMDSISEVGLSTVENIDFSNIKSLKYQLSKLPLNEKQYFYQEFKLLNALTQKVDSTNREQLKKIIKKYGYPDYDLRPWQNDSTKTGITYVLTHINYFTPEGKDILKLVLKEYEKGRISDGEIKHILWDANGRVGQMGSLDMSIESMILMIKRDFNL